jgi:hypothetical protein
MKKQSAIPRIVSVEIDGKTSTGSYAVEGKSVTVTYDMRSQTTHAPDGPAEHVARMLLRELVPGGTGMD